MLGLTHVATSCIHKGFHGMIAGFAALDESAREFAHMVSLPTSDQEWRDRCGDHFGVPKYTDLWALAKQNDSVCGVVPITRMTRLVQDLPRQPLIQSLADMADMADVAGTSGNGAGVVWFEFRGSSQAGRRPHVWLKVQAVVMLICQRCMAQMAYVVDETVEFELFADEAKANAAQVEDEADPLAPEPLVANGPVSLLAIVEDQLILAIPYVPKHDACGAATSTDAEPVAVVKRESPFKVLENLKRNSK
jgi:uncharacterized protein